MYLKTFLSSYCSMIEFFLPIYLQSPPLYLIDDEIDNPNVNLSNRRIYVGVKHLKDGRKRDKSNGVVAGSRFLRSIDGKSPLYARDYSAYIADLIKVETPEGISLGRTERSMVLDGIEATRLGLNVTLQDGEPTLEDVQGVKILNVRSGIMALETLTHLYSKLHPDIASVQY